MKQTVGLQKYNIQTDLAIDKMEIESLNRHNKIFIQEVKIDLKESKKIGKKPGLYTTISFMEIEIDRIKKTLIKVLKKYLINIDKDDLVLIIGLGNSLSTPDSLGPKVIDKIVVTNHLYNLELCNKKYQKVAAIAPSVVGKTGIESYDQIKCMINHLKPRIVIAIDSLLTSSISRLNKTIQITNTGINPGSGMGNFNHELSIDTLGVPIIAIGVPTVLNASTINYNSDKIIDDNLVVTPKDIDFIIDNLSEIISASLNIIFSS